MINVRELNGFGNEKFYDTTKRKHVAFIWIKKDIYIVKEVDVKVKDSHFYSQRFFFFFFL